MKIRITAILLFFASTFAFNGLMAQTPGPVHGTKTDQEVQTQDEDSADRTYSRKETQEKESWNKAKDRQTQKGKNAKKDQTGAATSCNGDKKGKRDYKGAKKEESRTKDLDRKALKQTTTAHKGQMKKEHKSFKKHPIFERRTDATNGKGEKG